MGTGLGQNVLAGMSFKLLRWTQEEWPSNLAAVGVLKMTLKWGVGAVHFSYKGATGWEGER